MNKRAVFILSASLILIVILIVISGCAWQQLQPPAKELPEEEEVEEETAEETEAEELAKEEEEEEAAEEVPVVEQEEEIIVEPVPEKAKYKEAEPEPSKEERDTCGCSFRWDPVCGNDGKTYMNQCLFQCFGNSLDDMDKNAQCPKKKSLIDIYVDDIKMEYESDKWNGGYCWRQMYRESGIRYCENLIVNGRVNEGPEPARGNWIDEDHLVMDKAGRKDSNTIKLKTGELAINEEYEMLFQPLFEEGRYRFSFWARQDVAANNDWKAELMLKDWWDEKPRPVGVNGCYKVMTEINCNEHFLEDPPNKWRHYHYEFDVPLNLTQWSSYERESAECEYDWDNVPHGYRIKITGPTVGEAWFDDFSLVKIR